jgi:hypothetical protein
MIAAAAPRKRRLWMEEQKAVGSQNSPVIGESE